MRMRKLLILFSLMILLLSMPAFAGCGNLSDNGAGFLITETPLSLPDGWIVGDVAVNETDVFYISAEEQEMGVNMKEIFEEDDDPYTSVSLAKLEEMKVRLNSGYTSFWS